MADSIRSSERWCCMSALRLLLLLAAAVSSLHTAAAAEQLIWLSVIEHNCAITCTKYSKNYWPVRSPMDTQGKVTVCAVRTNSRLMAGHKLGPYGCSYFNENSRAATLDTSYLCLCASSKSDYSWAESSKPCTAGHRLTDYRICALHGGYGQFNTGYVTQQGGKSHCRTSRGSVSWNYMQLCAAQPKFRLAVQWGRNCRGSWGPYSSCSKPCGGGQQSRKYTVTQSAGPAGRSCPFRNGQTQKRACNVQPCRKPQDCKGAWSLYTPCSKTCGGGTQTQVFEVTTPATNGGKACPYSDGYRRSRQCNTQACGTDCVGSWSITSPCNATCGSGFQTRTFRISKPATNGGRQCDFTDGEVQTTPCSTNVTCGLDCVGSWTAWGPCGNETSCGTSTQSSTYLVTTPAGPNGAPCESTNGTVQNRTCDTGLPCATNCVGNWTAWGPCGDSNSCGEANQSSTFLVTRPATGNGLDCEAANGTVRSQTCDTGRPCVPSTNGILAVGGTHTCYVSKDQDMKCVGGINDYSKSVVPGGTTGVKVLGAGSSQSCAVNNQGFVCWEGIKPYNANPIPAGFDASVDAISVGGNHACARKGGDLICFGSNGNGQATVPETLRGVVRSVATGYFHTCAVTTASNTVCFGRNAGNQTSVPAAVSGKSAAVCAGQEHTCVLTTDNSVICWGNNEFGQTSVPASLTGQRVTALTCGYFHNCVITAPDGAVTCWGHNLYKESTPPAGLTGVLQIGAGGVHTCALLQGPKITCWGDNQFKQYLTLS